MLLFTVVFIEIAKQYNLESLIVSLRTILERLNQKTLKSYE